MLRNIPHIMSKGRPVTVIFSDENGDESPHLYCELIQKARFGESFIIRNQRCPVGAFVLGDSDANPSDYYYNSSRYRNRKAAESAVSSLSRLSKREKSIKIAPYSGEDFDVLILFLTPERAMRLIQAYAYWNGNHVELKSGGIASICSDCTVSPLQGKFVLSPGCKGSRKHSMYGDDEVIMGIPQDIARRIDIVLDKIPETRK
ncbi:MAG: DUF169 domain-containing protein [Candidatus Methanoperedens sp.]|nr:DUF169 domain-containing protein [Candidatus Methanoperedens sp.]MCE8426077.1 DUF169 domain-containing protein [Candidatus Methanoperedens sp.]MCE8428823.1 DUF169 domain-containing protein [Candidatus Methanoperedens sp.]